MKNKWKTITAIGALTLMLGVTASGQMAELPFFTEKSVPPNILFFIDSSGSMDYDGDPDTPDTQRRMNILVEALAGDEPYVITDNGREVYYPHMDTNTTGEFWVADDIGIKVSRVRKDWNNYYYDLDGDYFIFYGPYDSFEPDANDALDTMDSYLREMGESCIKAVDSVDMSGESGIANIHLVSGPDDFSDGNLSEYTVVNPAGGAPRVCNGNSYGGSTGLAACFGDNGTSAANDAIVAYINTSGLTDIYFSGLLWTCDSESNEILVAEFTCNGGGSWTQVPGASVAGDGNCNGWPMTNFNANLSAVNSCVENNPNFGIRVRMTTNFSATERTLADNLYVRGSYSSSDSSREVFQAADCADPLSIPFVQAMRMYWEYEEYGYPGGGGTNPPVVVPVTDNGCSYYSGRVWRECYLPTGNTGYNRFAIYDDFGSPSAGERLVDTHTMDWEDYWNDRGQFEYYCPYETEEVWGDDLPQSEWIYDRRGWPRSDGNTYLARQIYYPCGAGDSGAIPVGRGLTDDTTIENDLLARLEEADDVDRYPVCSDCNEVDGVIGPEFVKDDGTRIDNYLRDEIGIPQPNISEFSINDPYFGGYFDHCYYDLLWQENPGIMDIYTDVNYGIMKFHNNSGSDKPDFDNDQNNRNLGAELMFNLTTWAGFPLYLDTTVEEQNDYLQETFVNYAALEPDGGTPIASALHDIYRYFYNVEFNNKTDTNPSMFFNLEWPAISGNEENMHIVQDDPFYCHGCRKNFLIYLTDGCQTDGEPLGYYDGNPSTIGSPSELSRIKARQQLLVNLLKDGPADTTCKNNVADSEEQEWCGVRSYFIGFALDPDVTVDAKGMSMLTGMAQAAVMDHEEDPIDDYILASNPAELFAAFNRIMSTILAGDYARTAPEVSATQNAAVTTFFEIDGSSYLWKGHMFAYSQVKDGNTVTFPPAWEDTDASNDAAVILENTSEFDREIYTVNESQDKLEFIVSNQTTICPMLFPDYDCNANQMLSGDSTPEIIKFIRGAADATFASGEALTHALGAIYHSRPRIVSPPNNPLYGYLPGYGEFAAAHADRTSLVYVGTLFGMLHAFSFKDDGDFQGGEEVFSFVPHGALPYLHHLRDGEQIGGVDATPVIKDLYFPDDAYNTDVDNDGDQENWERWHTMLVSGAGQGGEYYFALDVTDADTTDRFDNVIPQWEFRDDRLAYTWSVPVLGLVNHEDGPSGYMPAAFFGGGLQEASKVSAGNISGNKGGRFYVVNAQDGSTLKTFELYDINQVIDITDISTTDGNTNYNQVPGSPILLDVNGDNIFDRAYVGDYQGRLWKINMASADPDNWQHCIIYDMADKNGDGDLDDAGDIQDAARTPIWYTPMLAKGPNDLLLVYFYTGHVEVRADASDDSRRNYMYALADQDLDNECTYASPLSEVVGDTLEWPIVFAPGEKPTSDMLMTSGNIYFPTFQPLATQPCAPGTILLYRVNYQTGSYTVADITSPADGSGGGSSGGGVSFLNGTAIQSNTSGEIVMIETIPIPPAMPMSWGEGMTF